MENIGDKKEAYLYYPADKDLTYFEILKQKLNYWRSQLVDRTANYHEAVSRFIANPTGIIKTASGVDMSLAEIVNARLVAIKETKSLVLIGEKMLAELAVSQEAMMNSFLKDDVLKEAEFWLAIDKKDLEPSEETRPEPADIEEPKPDTAPIEPEPADANDEESL